MNRLHFLLMSMLMALLASAPLMASHCHTGHDSPKKDKSETEKKTSTQKLCPIKKKPIDKDVFLEYQGQKVYFCCEGCDKKFLKDPIRYFEEMKTRGEVTESVQTRCAVNGDELGEDKIALTLPGRRVYFCRKKCVSKFKKDPERYLNEMVKKGEEEAKEEHGGSHKH